MKTIRTALVLVAFMACTPQQKQIARTALDVAQTACIIANAALPESKVAEICGITTPFIAPMRQLLAASKAASAAAARPAQPVVCSGDESNVECFPETFSK